MTQHRHVQEFEAAASTYAADEAAQGPVAGQGAARKAGGGAGRAGAAKSMAEVDDSCIDVSIIRGWTRISVGGMLCRE